MFVRINHPNGMASLHECGEVHIEKPKDKARVILTTGEKEYIIEQEWNGIDIYQWSFNDVDWDDED